MKILAARVKRNEHQLALYNAGRHAPTQGDPAGAAQLRNIRTAMDLASGADALLLIDVNKARTRHQAFAKLKDRKDVRLWITAAAGLWNGYLTTGDEAYLKAMRNAYSLATRREPTDEAGHEYGELLGFMHKLDADDPRPTPPAAIQRKQIAAGNLKPEDAINFDTTPKVFAMLYDLCQQRAGMQLNATNKYFGSGAKAREKKRAAAAPYLAKIKALKKKIDAYDKAHGHPSRFASR